MLKIILGEYWRVKAVAILIVITAIVAGIVSHFYLPNDNPIEEAAESVIERELGLSPGDFDLSPSDPEPRKLN